VERAVARELTAQREVIAGQVRDGKHGGLDSVRATLQRLFVGFELASSTAMFGSDALHGQPWGQRDPDGRTCSAQASTG
jgi:hypothetical protein